MVFHLIDFAIILILIVGISRFRKKAGARLANLSTAFVMLCALILVLYRGPVLEPVIVFSALIVGAAIAWIVAARVRMIHIPALVAFQNGAGGAAACIVSLVQLTRAPASPTAIVGLFGVLGLVTGAAAFSASMIATGKLTNLVKQTPIIFPMHTWVLCGIAAAIVMICVVGNGATGPAVLYYSLSLILLAVLLGVVFSVRIGGADMAVSISFLNAMTGLAAAFCGIVIQNRLLIACGATVAASGSVLTHAMCKAMNRKLLNVFAGIQLKTADEPAQAMQPDAQELSRQSASVPIGGAPGGGERGDPLLRAVEAAKNAKKIIIIPGYGMALAHAQFEIVELSKKLQDMGKDVKFAIHPVAGRMPGHMNVLLAEAEVHYDKLFEMDEINPEFKETDLALIVGACDVVNPAAINKEGTPISGMPILMVHQAKQVVVCNLDRKPGYSGVENPLYDDRKAILLFGDAKASVERLSQGLD